MMQGCAITIARRPGLAIVVVGQAKINAVLAHRASKSKGKVNALFVVQPINITATDFTYELTLLQSHVSCENMSKCTALLATVNSVTKCRTIDLSGGLYLAFCSLPNVVF
jgi:hypothetical protein